MKIVVHTHKQKSLFFWDPAKRINVGRTRMKLLRKIIMSAKMLL